MLTNLAVTDFKAFKELDLELRPLTVLLGPNNTGKSSIIAPIRLLAQTLIGSDPSVAVLLDGPFGDFGTFKDVVFENRPSSVFRISLSGFNPARASREAGGGWRLDASFGYRTRRRQLILSEVEIADDAGHILTATYVPDSDKHVVSKIRGKELPSKYRGRSSKTLALMHFLPYLTVYRAGPHVDRLFGGMFSEQEIVEVDQRVDAVIYAARRDLLSAEFIGAMRVPLRGRITRPARAVLALVQRERTGRACWSWIHLEEARDPVGCEAS